MVCAVVGGTWSVGVSDGECVLVGVGSAMRCWCVWWLGGSVGSVEGLGSQSGLQSGLWMGVGVLVGLG